LREEFGDDIGILFDPQFYASTLLQARDGHLSEYGYYRRGLTRANFLTAEHIRQFASSAVNYQASLPLSGIISPTILLEDFGNAWSQIALSLAMESINEHAKLVAAPPLYVSLVAEENALRNKDSLGELLDIISLWEMVAGFYVIVRPNDLSYPSLMQSDALSNLMYLVYALSLNGFDVVCGYSDLVGILLQAVGARVAGSGWYSSLRQFSLSRFQPAKGGRAPRPRYTSSGLLNSVLVIPELDAIYQAGFAEDVLSRSSYDGAMYRGPAGALAGWNPEMSCMHHWEVIDALSARLSGEGSVGGNLDALESAIDTSLTLYRAILGSGIVFEAASGPRNLPAWRDGIQAFRAEAGI
jgi:hypothetical protein